MGKANRSGNPKVVVGYCRVSTEDQNLGPQAQRSAMDRWCKANGARLVACYEDHGVSGAAPLDKRPALIEALDAVAEHGAGVLLVAKRDRLARDPIVAAMTERLVERAGARVLSAAGEGTEGDDPGAVLMRRMIDAFAEYERAMIRARTRAALAVKRSRGEKLGGDVPYGYRLAADGVHLDTYQPEMRIVVAARKLREQGMSLRQIGAALEARGLLPRCGRPWNPKTVRALLPVQEAMAA